MKTTIKNSEIISLINPKSPTTEAYRSLLTNIEYSSVDHQIKTIAVTSSAPSEGKSTTVANLAVTYADTGKRVLLVDCDLRKPRLNKLFNVSNLAGLTSVLTGKASLSESIKLIKEGMLVILDTPPVGLVTDAALISAKLDGVILVVASGKSQTEAVLRAKESLMNVNANLLGAVMTMVPTSNGYQYYAYAGEEPTKKKRFGK